MFPEFKFMGYALGFLIFMGLLPVIIGRRTLLPSDLRRHPLHRRRPSGLWDFYRWGHEYGHNLDPKAAISVPGMTYDPPIIGYKNLLNFTAYSGPDKGGWILIVAGGIAVALLAWEMWRTRKTGRANIKPGDVVTLAVILGAMILLPGCEQRPASHRLRQGCLCRVQDDPSWTNASERNSSPARARSSSSTMSTAWSNSLNANPTPVTLPPKASSSSSTEMATLVEKDQLVFVNHKKLRTPMRSHVAAFR